MPADCEIDGCGVLAVGRCGRCGRAFCATHREFLPLAGDRCGPCYLWAKRPAEPDPAAVAYREALEARITYLLGRLEEEGVPKGVVRTSYRQRKWSKKLVREETWHPSAAWPVGEMTWDVEPPHGDFNGAPQTCVTGITPDRELVTLGTLGPDGEVRGGPAGQPIRPQETWACEQVLDALQALAAAHHVPVERQQMPPRPEVSDRSLRRAALGYYDD